MTYPIWHDFDGHAGIHGIQMNWETPRVVAFFREDRNGDYPIDGGQVSPDGHWYAVPVGEVITEVSYNTYWFVNGVRVYSTSGDGQVLSFDLGDYLDIYRYFEVAWSYLPIEWRDNTSLVIGGILLHPFDGRAEAAGFDLEGSMLDEQFVSPDLTRAYGIVGYEDDYQSGFHDLINHQILQNELASVDGMSWRRDSSGFMAVIHDKKQNWNGLAYYDRDGTLLERIIDLDEGSVDFHPTASGRNDQYWSPDGERFAFVYDAPYPNPSRLHIIDWEQQVVIDTCLSPISAPVWSPDGTMLAYLALARENLKVIVLDWQSWQAYDVARHNGIRGRFVQYGRLGGNGRVTDRCDDSTPSTTTRTVSIPSVSTRPVVS
jgi:hypothetical protein